MKFETENGFRYLKMFEDKLYQITEMATNGEQSNVADTSSSLTLSDEPCCLMDIGGMPGAENVHVLGCLYDSVLIGLGDLDTVDRPFTQLYVQVYTGDIFQIAAVVDSVEEGNQLLLQREDISLIDSTQMKSLDRQLHFLASNEPVIAVQLK
ncbi:hypothetical protein [Vibrio sp.]|uniref:hypothetical protein n=1 Tax=Vibrio sp. TaxID=678 RepID=UPI003D0AAC6B